MAVIQAMVLGIVQGLTEFLPVSSSGHLVLGQNLFGLKEPELLFDVVVHVGTLLAVLIVFRRDIINLVRELSAAPRVLSGPAGFGGAWRERPEFRMLVLIIIGSVPTGLIGVFFKDLFEALFASTLAVGISLLITGAVLFLTRRIDASGREITGFRPVDALIIGTAQGLAITPGISRSGLTIGSGLILGLDRELAARYSFLLSIPAILGALFLELKSASGGSFGIPELGAGFAAAMVSGLAALLLLLRLVRRGKLHYFAYYCWLVGLVTIGSHLAR